MSTRWIPTAKFPAVCEGCGLTYGVTDDGEPDTYLAYTCDDCGGYVDVEL